MADKIFSKVLVVFISAVLIFGTLEVYNLYVNLINVQRISNNYLSHYAVKCEKVNDNDSFSLLFDYIKDSELIFYNDIDRNMDIRTVLCGDAYESPPIKSGRFFRSSDFEDNRNYAVIGENMLEYVYYINDKRYFKFNNDYYEIIGILGLDRETSLDEMVLLSYNSKTEDISRFYTIDGNNKFCINNFTIQNYFTDNFVIVESKESGAARVINLNIMDFLIIILVAVFFILSFAAVLLYWNKKNQYQFFIRKMMGQSFIYIFINLIRDLFILNLIGFCLAAAVYFIFFENNLKAVSMIACSLIFLAVLFIISSASVFAFFISKNKKPIAENLK